MTLLDAKRILGISGDLNLEDAKSRYRNLVKKYHPDFYEGASLKEKEAATAKTAEIIEAYEYIKQYIENHTQSSSYDFSSFNLSMAIRRAKRDCESIFVNCSDSTLKTKVFNGYKKINFDSCSTETEVNNLLKKFYDYVGRTYSEYHNSFRIDNGISRDFNFNITLNCDVDDFLDQMDDLKSKWDNYIISILKNRISLYKEEDSYIKFSDFIKKRFSQYEFKLRSYYITENEINSLIEDFDDECAVTAKYFETNKKEYLHIKNVISNLPESFDSTGRTKKELINSLERSIFLRTFETDKTVISDIVSSFNKKNAYTKKMFKVLRRRSNFVLSMLDQDTDKHQIDSIYETMLEVNNRITLAREGKYSINELSRLSNIKFKDASQDRVVISMLDGLNYNIYVALPKDGLIDDIKYDPFVLTTSDGKQVISKDGNKAYSYDSLEYSEDNMLIPLSEFISKGSSVNKYSVAGKVVENVICEYDGYEIVCIRNKKNNNLIAYYITTAKPHDSYRKSNVDSEKSIVKDVRGLYQPYINKLQRKSIEKELLKARA